MPAITIVGASLAGLQAAQTLRRADFDGSITIVGDEPHYPYDRPPLSKQFLAGDWEEEKLRLRAAADPDELGVEWRLGTSATELRLDDRVVGLSDGTSLSFDGLVVATGASPRTLPGPGLVLRSLDDARAIRDLLDGGVGKLCVIGAGFIGAEVAATARARGVEVTMIEAAASPLARVLDEAAGMAIAQLHQDRGVDVRLGVGVAAIEERPGGGAAVQLAGGESIEADLVVVGIGVVPNTSWLEGSGLELDDGIVCDQTCLAAPGVVSAGDVTRWPNLRFGGEMMRVEQWDNAVDQGAYAAKRLLAELAGEPAPDPFMPVPWFWSDQYDRKIQLAGVPSQHVVTLDGLTEMNEVDVAPQRLVQLYTTGPEGSDDAKLSGALVWNRPRQAIMSRQLVERGATLGEARESLGG